MKIQRTKDIGFVIEKDGQTIFVVNLKSAGLYLKLLNIEHFVMILDTIFWRGTLLQSWFMFKRDSNKIRDNIDWRFLIIQGAIQVKHK
jgi:hypothetical protein